MTKNKKTKHHISITNKQEFIIKQILTLTFEGSIGTLLSVTFPGPSSTTERATTSSAAVWTQRRKGDTKIRWIGNSRLCRILRPVWKVRIRPAWARGGSHGRVAVDAHKGSKLSMRSPCLITMTFWYETGCWFSIFWFPLKSIFTVCTW